VDHNKVITTQVIEDVVNKTSADRLPISDLIDAMESIGFGLVIMFFSCGIVFPLPPPFPSIIAAPLIIFSLQMLMGYEAPKLPKRFAKLTVKRSTLAMLLQKISPFIRKAERVLRPRLSFAVSGFAERVIGFFLFLFASFVLLPVPLSNFIPGLGILITSFGLMGKDGLFVIFGIIVGIIGMIVSVAAIFLGVEMFNYVKGFFW
jgi:hypothetical protein